MSSSEMGEALTNDHVSAYPFNSFLISSYLLKMIIASAVSSVLQKKKKKKTHARSVMRFKILSRASAFPIDNLLNAFGGWCWRRYVYCHGNSVLQCVTEQWSNGTPNSSQLEPSCKPKTCIGGWPNGTAKSSQLTRKPFNCLTTTLQSPNDNKTTWRQLAWVGQMVENLALLGQKIEL